MGPTRESRSRVSELVRSAEKQILSGRHDSALEQLHRAQELDPQNQYIQAVIQRAELARQNPGRRHAEDPLQPPGHQSSRYLSVTVGDDSAGGGHRGAPQTLSDQETTRRIRELTETAQVLLNRGLRESAFDTLMRAYLLDPLHPDVISCEQKVLPAWEDLRRLRSLAPTPSVMTRTPAEGDQSLRGEEAAGARERELWRTLSGPPPRATSGNDSPPPKATRGRKRTP
jgi:tetratricopeptide (TPR) repeat protein